MNSCILLLISSLENEGTLLETGLVLYDDDLPAHDGEIDKPKNLYSLPNEQPRRPTCNPPADVFSPKNTCKRANNRVIEEISKWLILYCFNSCCISINTFSLCMLYKYPKIMTGELW